MLLGTKVGRPGDILLDGDPALPTEKDRTAPKYSSWFTDADRAACVCKLRPMSVVVKRSPISASAEHLLLKAF